MSTDTHSAPGFRCEPITTDTISSPCAHNRLANVPHLRTDDSEVGQSHRDDPAVLIGLALAFVRQGPLLDGHVPEPLMGRLHALADDGNAASRLLLDWLRNRNRDFRCSGNEDLASSIPAVASADTSRPRRSRRDRIPAAPKETGGIDGRRRVRTRPRGPVHNPKTAIIAAETGARADG